MFARKIFSLKFGEQLPLPCLPASYAYVPHLSTALYTVITFSLLVSVWNEINDDNVHEEQCVVYRLHAIHGTNVSSTKSDNFGREILQITVRFSSKGGN